MAVSILYTPIAASYDLAVVRANVNAAFSDRFLDFGVTEDTANFWLRLSAPESGDQIVFDSVVKATTGTTQTTGLGGAVPPVALTAYEVQSENGFLLLYLDPAGGYYNLVLSAYGTGGDIVLRPDLIIRPYTDDTYPLGNSSFRWTDIKVSKPTDFAWGRIVANRLALPGLRGLWNMNSSYVGNSATNLVLDESHNERDLTPNNTPVFSVYQVTGLPEVPYVDLDGTNMNLSRADETALDITGALTLMGWFWADVTTATQRAAGKFLTTGNQKSYQLTAANSNNKWEALISTDGSTNFTIEGPALTASAWHHAVLRFVPSTSLDVIIDGSKTSNTTSVPASIFNSTAVFRVGAQDTGSNYLNGRVALLSLHAAALTDEAIAADFAQSRALFGV